MSQGRINGGFFVIEPAFLNYMENDTTVLERAPLEKVAQNGEMNAFLHDGFWQCMDTKRDLDYLEGLWLANGGCWEPKK